MDRTVDEGEPAADPDAAATGLPRGVVLLLGAAALVICAAGMYWVSWLLGPILLALMIVIAVYPIKTWMQRRGWPSWAAVLTLLVVIFGAVVVLVAFLVVSVAQLATLISQNAGRSQQLVDSVRSQLTRFGVGTDQASSAAGSANAQQLAARIGGVLASLGSVVSSLVFILALLLFLTAESGGTTRRMTMLAEQRPHMVQALMGFVSGTRNYLVVTTVFGGIVAVLDTVALWIMGVPLALLWGVLAFLTNYIPNVGFLIGLVPPAVVALMLGGWQTALAVVIVYSVLNLVIQSLIQPRFVGDSVGLSATVTFVALLFWAWILGPLGALLAIPMSLLAKAVLVDADPRAKWVEALLGAEPPKPDSERAARRSADIPRPRDESVPTVRATSEP